MLADQSSEKNLPSEAEQISSESKQLASARGGKI